MDEAEKLRILTAQVDRLILDWERFFAGERKTPPQDERQLVARRLRLLGESGFRSRTNQFRLEQLQQRFHTYNALWERQLRVREEGRKPGMAAAGVAAPANAEAAKAVQESEDRGRALYERYCAAKRALGEDVRLDEEGFVTRLARQRKALEKHLGEAVRFDVVVRDGKVKLAARGRNRNGNGG